MLSWIVWNRTIWLNWITWNRNVFDNSSVYSCQSELFEIELIICIKMDLALNNLQRLIYYKNQPTDQPWPRVVVPVRFLSCHAASTDFPDSLSILFYHLSFPAGLLDNILCPYRAVVHPILMHPRERVHRRTSLMSLSLCLQQCPMSLIWMILEMGGKWPHSCCLLGCCFQNLFNISHSILVQFLFCFFSICLISIHVVIPYSRVDTTATWKKLHLILSYKSDFHMIDNL